jgi:hypothetical protein
MTLRHSFALLVPWLLLALPDFLLEPDYALIQENAHWILQKPGFGARQPVTISRHDNRGAAEFRKLVLPRLRLDTWLVQFDPASNTRRPIIDWTTPEDARQIGAEVRELVNQFSRPSAKALLESTPLFMARLPGAVGHTAEDANDAAQFVIYVDPYRATSRLHMAATLVHELAHLERYRARSFHGNRAAAVLSKEDFVLLGLADEFAAYQAEAHLVRSFLRSRANEAVRRSAIEAMRNPELNWPLALIFLLEPERSGSAPRGMIEARRHVILDLKESAGRYWETRRLDSMEPALQRIIRDWHRHSREWRQISAERAKWREAQTRTPGSSSQP